MKELEKILNKICVITMAVYFFCTMGLVLAQAGALVMLNGELCATIFSTLKLPAGYAAAATAVLAFVLAYLRGDMTPDKD